MIDCRNCREHGKTIFRDGECIYCIPIKTISLNGSSVSVGALAQIATHLEKYGRVVITNAALAENPGLAALMMGIKVGEQGAANG